MAETEGRSKPAGVSWDILVRKEQEHVYGSPYLVGRTCSCQDALHRSQHWSCALKGHEGVTGLES